MPIGKILDPNALNPYFYIYIYIYIDVDCIPSFA